MIGRHSPHNERVRSPETNLGEKLQSISLFHVFLSGGQKFAVKLLCQSLTPTDARFSCKPIYVYNKYVLGNTALNASLLQLNQLTKGETSLSFTTMEIKVRDVFSQ